MNLAWRKEWEFEVGFPGMWKPNYDGSFMQLENDLYGYVYLENSSIALKIFNHKGFLNERLCPIEHPTVPSSWIIKKKEKSWIVYCNQQSQFLISSNGHIQKATIAVDLFNKPNPYHFSNDPFVFGDFLIEHKGPYGYLCSIAATRKKLWEIKVQGYLYADMKRIGDRLYICTVTRG